MRFSAHRVGRAAGHAAGLAAALVCSVAILPAPAAARPLTPAETRDQSYSGLVKACQDPQPLGYISGAFAARESEYWHSGLTILGFRDVEEIGFRANGLDFIPRRYCHAQAVMSDNKVRSVSFHITEAGGGIGFTDNVVWCVVGLDRDNSFAPGCKEAEP